MASIEEYSGALPSPESEGEDKDVVYFEGLRPEDSLTLYTDSGIIYHLTLGEDIDGSKTATYSRHKLSQIDKKPLKWSAYENPSPIFLIGSCQGLKAQADHSMVVEGAEKGLFRAGARGWWDFQGSDVVTDVIERITHKLAQG
ncbi:MAG TPA: hypothetical protein VHD84_02200 [Candidatus Saccharimonadales bacterium]|nr:hypothetical protein [Candidatus Saccharimonadales bacterium]